MSSEKSDEFSLDGLDDLDLSENADDESLTSVEEEGLDLDLSEADADFSLSEEGEDIPSGETPDPNEFSLTNVGINISLAEASEDAPSDEAFPEDLIDLGEEGKEDYSLGEDEASLDESFNLDDSEGLDDSLNLDSSETADESFNLDDSEGLDQFSLGDDEVPEVSATEEDLFGVNEAAQSQENADPVFKMDSDDLTADVRAKLKEIDAIMEEDATRGAFITPLPEDDDDAPVLAESTDEDISLSLSDDDVFSVEESSTPANDDLNLNFESETDLGEVNSLGDDAFGLSDSLEDEAPAAPALSASEEEAIVDIVDEPLVGDLNLSDLNIEENEEEEEVIEAPVAPKKKKKKETAIPAAATPSQNFQEISQAYTGEMERTQATIANLRADRDELLARIDKLEEEKLLGHRNTLSLRAELDEKKIELTIIRKKLNEEINDLKDRIRIYEEKVLILEEKNKQLHQEIESAGQKNKIDVKRVMLRERELEQKLELLKADAETQIRNRDLKILELKRKIDAMEFDMESITQQEKKTLESRFELEDKLDKAIRTLRSAISTLEEDGDRSATLDAIKKNIEM